MMTTFHARIDAIRRERGLSYRALGKLVGMSHGNVHKLLTSTHEAPRPPLGADLELWFDVLGTSEADEPLLRLLAAAEHIPDPTARAQVEAIIIAHMEEKRAARVAEPRRGNYQIGALSTRRTPTHRK